MQIPTTIIGAATLVTCLMLGTSERGTAQGVRWEYGQIVTNSGGLVIAWTAPDSQHVWCPDVPGAASKKPAPSPTTSEESQRELEIIGCELLEGLSRIARMDIALNADPSPESYERVKADTVHYPRIQPFLTSLGREGWEVTGPPETTFGSSGNRLYTLKRARRH